MEHLGEVVRQVERGSAMNLVARVPIQRCDDVLESDSLLDVGDADLGEASQDQRTVTVALASPIDLRVLVCHRHQDVEGAHAGRGERAVGDTGVLDIERRGF
jgi:hypothetical protein